MIQLHCKVRRIGAMCGNATQISKFWSYVLNRILFNCVFWKICSLLVREPHKHPRKGKSPHFTSFTCSTIRKCAKTQATNWDVDHLCCHKGQIPLPYEWQQLGVCSVSLSSGANSFLPPSKPLKKSPYVWRNASKTLALANRGLKLLFHLEFFLGGWMGGSN